MRIKRWWPFLAIGFVQDVWVMVQFYFEPRDIWVGLYWKSFRGDIDFYLCLVPMLPLHIKLEDFWLGRT